MNITAEYGCCLNTILSVLIGSRYEYKGIFSINILLILCSNEVAEQIEYVILTREIYYLCVISSGGFCNGVH